MQRLEGPRPSGVLHLAPGEQHFGHARLLPAVELRPLVDFYWTVRWDLRGKPRRLAETLPHPCVFWITELEGSAIYGVGTQRFSRWLTGKGRVCGVRFRPGGFYPFYQKPIATLTDRKLSLRSAFGTAGAAIGRQLISLDRSAAASADTMGDVDQQVDGQMMDLLDQFLLDRLPKPDPKLILVTDILSAIRTSPDLLAVGPLAQRFDLTVRSLQRLFDRYVGVSPKWVIKRYRIHEALGRVDAGRAVDWARLAVELGYFDQTHFTKDFKAMTGRSPGEYEKGPAKS